MHTAKLCRTIPKAFGTAGVDGMPVNELYAHLTKNRQRIESEIRQGKYLPKPILGVEPSEASS